MTRRTTGKFPIWAVAVASLSLLGAQAVAQEPRQGVDWPQFRGVRASGVADGFGAPIHWNAETGENILWKTPVRGLGHSSPVVWGDLVCVTTADSGQADELKVGPAGDSTTPEINPRELDARDRRNPSRGDVRLGGPLRLRP